MASISMLRCNKCCLHALDLVCAAASSGDLVEFGMENRIVFAVLEATANDSEISRRKIINRREFAVNMLLSVEKSDKP